MSKPVCVVIGVGPGNGAALARRFAAEGYAVALLARSTGFSEHHKHTSSPRSASSSEGSTRFPSSGPVRGAQVGALRPALRGGS